MDGIGTELRRLGRAYARSEGVSRVRRAHLLALALFALLALLSRTLGPFPVVAPLHHAWLLAPLVVIGLVLARHPIEAAVRAFVRPRPRAFARALDDRLGLADAASTALDLPPAARAEPLGAYLVAHAEGRLRQADPARLWPPAKGRSKWPTLLLGGLALFALLAPGVFPSLGSPPSARSEPSESEPLDADAWMRRHGRALLAFLRPGTEDPAALRASFLTDRPLPEPVVGRLALEWDRERAFPIGDVRVAKGSRADVAVDVRLDGIEGMRPFLTPGSHVAVAVVVFDAPPWRVPVRSEELKIEWPEGGGPGGGGASPSAAPKPEPEPAKPPDPTPAPTPDGPKEEPTPPPRGPAREEVVKPLVDPGATVRKEGAVVAVPDPDAGVKPPKRVPLADALREFEKVVESAVGGERLGPGDREFLLRYFEALRRAAGPGR
jgi:hypothetical protein